MSEIPPRQDNLDRFVDRYGTALSTTSLQIGRDACGHDHGLSGYTTLAEAQDLAHHLPLGAGSRILDLGSGWGWPAIHFAAEGRCTVVATDVPTEGLHQAADLLPLRAAADARALPFPAGSFDAISHSDVFC